MAVIALCVTAAYSPVVESQETKNEAALGRCAPDTALPRASAADRTEIPEMPAPQTAQLMGIPEAQGQSSPSSS